MTLINITDMNAHISTIPMATGKQFFGMSIIEDADLVTLIIISSCIEM